MKPQLQHLLIFGSLANAHIDNSKRTKVDAKSYRYMVLGYASNTKGHKVFDLETKTGEVCRTVVLDGREVGSIYEDNPEKTATTTLVINLRRMHGGLGTYRSPGCQC